MYNNIPHFQKSTAKYIGWTFTGVVPVSTGDPEFDAMHPFAIRLTKGKKVVFVLILSDSEGNGPGFLDICEGN
jgi:hypothetical protein